MSHKLSSSQLCISDGRLKTAASYLIIIQNLEASTVSRQVGFHGYHGYHSYMHAVLPSHVQYTVLKHGAQTVYLPLLPLFLRPQLATRLLDAALDNNQWEVSFICCHSNHISTVYSTYLVVDLSTFLQLCKDLVRFLRAIGTCNLCSVHGA